MKNRFLALFIVIVMLLSQMSVFAIVPDLELTSTNPEDKLTDELKKVMSNTEKGEYIPIVIDINVVNDSAVYDVLSQRLGTTITADSEEFFLNQQIETKIDQYNSYAKKADNSQVFAISADEHAKSIGINSLRTICDLSSVMSNEELTTCIDKGMQIEEIIELSERNQFLSNWRNVRKELNSMANTTFIEKLDCNMCSVIYIDPILTRLTLNCKKEYIFSIASFGETEKIGYFVNDIELFNDVNLTTTQNSFSEYHMTEYTNSDYDGSGVKVGVIELHEGAKGYDETNIHLINKNISYRGTNFDSQTDVISSHATTVLAIIAGDIVSSNENIEYSGVAPNVTLSLAYINEPSDIASAMDWLLITENVSVINFSIGGNQGYNNLCADFDDYVQLYRVNIVKSAGNTNNVTSPGMAYNIITVGNVGILPNNAGCALLDGSGFRENEGNLTNKPDICAIGTNVFMLNASKNPENRTSGTSFAAPQVTGTIALMLQKDSSLIGNPHKIKTILLSSAYESAILEEDDDPILIQNPTSVNVDVIGITREKTGAGLLNTEGAISNTSNPMLYAYSYSYITDDMANGTHNYYEIAPGQVIKFGGLFEIDSDSFIVDINEAENITENVCNVSMNLRIIDMNGKTVFDSASPTDPASQNDNVKMFAISFPSGGYYKFELYFNTRNGMRLSGFDTEINAAMIISCACGEPLISKERVSYGTNESLDCNNCIFHIEEFWIGDVHKETFSEGTVSFVMQCDYDSMINPTSICCSNFSVEFQPNTPTKFASIILENENKSYTLTGYTEYRKYLILVFDTNAENHVEIFVDVTIEYDGVSLTYDLYG